jgi:hypothetical protein
MSHNNNDDNDSTPSPPRAAIHVPNYGTMDFAERELERLRVAMGFPIIDALVNFIGTGYVLAALSEFIANHLIAAIAAAGGGDYPIPSLNEVIGRIVADAQNQTGAYTTHNPDTANWDELDHWARFIQRVYTAAQAADSTWDGTAEPDFARVAWQLFELLLFLARHWIAMQL